MISDTSAQASFPAGLAERNSLIVEQLPYVRIIAQKIHARLPQHVPLEDLINTGVLGLIEALSKYDPRRKVSLKSYAGYRIRGAILDSLRAQAWGSRGLRQRGRQLEAAEQLLRGRLGRAPLLHEVARELKLSEAGVQELIGDLRGLTVMSLESSDFGAADHTHTQEPPALQEQNPFELCQQSEMNDLLARAIARLTARQQRLLQLYYFKSLNMKEVGTRLGVCESRVSQMHAVALRMLRRRINQELDRRVSHLPCRGTLRPIPEATRALRWSGQRESPLGSRPPARRAGHQLLASQRSAA